VNSEIAGEERAGIVTSTGGAPVFRYLAPEDAVVIKDEYGRPQPLMNGENFIARDASMKSETLSFELPGDSGIEYKAIMKQGDAMVFRWSTEGGQAYYDFHAHDEAFGPEFYTRYDEGEGDFRAGSVVAAYDGQHGWYWQNIGSDPITITLEVAGFYDEVIRMGL
jgi:hypothetical protein